MNYLSNISFGLRYLANSTNLEFVSFPYFEYDNLSPQLYYGMSYDTDLGTDDTNNGNDAPYANGATTTSSKVFSPNASLETFFGNFGPQYIQCPSLDISAVSTLCISFWMQSYTSGTPAGILFDCGTSLNGMYFAYQGASLKLFFRAWNISDFNRGDLISPSYSPGVYRHIILIVQNGYVEFYINNVLQYGLTNANVTMTSPLTPYFGRSDPDGSSSTFSSSNTNIDKINISYGNPSVNDRIQLYELDSIRAYYTFENFTTNILRDKVIVNDAAIFGTCITNTFSHSGSYSAFFSGNVASNSATNYIEFPELDMSKQVGCSFVFWIYNTDTTTGADSHVFDFTRDTSADTLFLRNNSSSVNNTSYTFGNQTFTMTVNTWNFCAITIGTPNVMKIYVNANAAITGTASLPTVKLDAGGLLSRTLDTGLNLQQFNGYIDQFQIYNWNLSSSAVSLLYTK